MVGMDADYVITFHGSRLFGEDLSDPRQGQFFEEARNVEVPAGPLLFPYYGPKPILGGMQVFTICL